MSDRSLRRGDRAQPDAWTEEGLSHLAAKVRAGATICIEDYFRLASEDSTLAAGYLLARLDRSDLTLEDLDLAVECDHEPALLALPQPQRSGWGGFSTLKTYGHRTLARAFAPVGRAALAKHLAGHPSHERCLLALDQLDVWLSSTSPSREEPLLKRLGTRCGGLDPLRNSREEVGACQLIFFGTRIPLRDHYVLDAMSVESFAKELDLDFRALATRGVLAPGAVNAE